jgi:hypothetical protein
LPGGTRRGSVRAGSERSGAVSLIGGHESCDAFSMAAPWAREKHSRAIWSAILDVWL